MSKIITVYARNVETKDGKKFTAFDTTDKHGNKVNVAFAMNGDPAPKAEDCPLVIELIQASMDKRKHFPTLRVWEYSAIGKPERVNGSLDDYFD